MPVDGCGWSQKYIEECCSEVCLQIEAERETIVISSYQ